MIWTRYWRSYRHLLALLVLFFVLPILGFPFATSSYALPKKDGPDGPDGPVSCVPEAEIELRFAFSGIEFENKVIRGRKLTLNAQSAKKVETRRNCTTVAFSLANNQYSWQLSNRPAGSTATLLNTDTLLVDFTPDLLGNYTITLIACPNTCPMTNITIQPTHFDVSLVAVGDIILPIASDPALPPESPATTPSIIPDANDRCLGGGGVADPQWVTVKQWNSPNDYELLEGRVEKSRISRKDNFLNHDSQDHLVHVRPDPLYRRLLRGSQEMLEVEWERNHLPEPFRATPGDRISVFGYWILDCGHDGPTEIHPPVGIAVQRPRAVAIPSDKLFRLPDPDGDDVDPYKNASVGSNIYVPGIVTDVWFNRRAGEITGNCSTTGLHQPGYYINTPQGRTPVQGDCINSPAVIDREFSFRIYLPPRPRTNYSYTVPLYVESFIHPFGFGAGPEPQIALAGTDEIPYLQVTIDMRGFTGIQYARQIRAGWVMPSPDNWGLRRWRLTLNAIDVHDDGDSRLRGDGDWRFWLNTNNGGPEWTKLYDCDGCVHGRETFGGRPWRTGDPGTVSADRSLGPDLLRFTKQRIWVHTSGFEADTLIDDDTGSVNDLRQQIAGRYTSRSSCTAQTDSGCASYTLEYELGLVGAVPASSLTIEGQYLYNSFKIGAFDSAVGCLNCLEQLSSWHPFDSALKADQPPLEIERTLLFRSQPSIESNALTQITPADFTATIEKTRSRGPQAIENLMRDLRGGTDELLSSPRADESRDDIAQMIGAIPADLRERYFGDLKLYQVSAPFVQR